MAQWLAFSLVAAGITALLLVLARQSQQVLEAASTETQPGFSDEPAHPAEPTEPTRNSETAVRPHQSEDSEPARQAPERSTAHQQSPRDSEKHREAKTSRESKDLRETETSRDPKELRDAKNPRDAEKPREGRSEPEELGYTDQSTLELTPLALLANVSLTQGLVAVAVVAAGWYFDIPAAAFGVAADPWSTGGLAILGGIAFGIALWLGNELATSLADAVGAAYDERMRGMLAPDSPGGWVLLFGVVLPIIATAEELLFRAALIGVPATGLDISPWLLAVVSSLAFALGHGAQGRVGIVVTGLLGFVLAAGYVLTGSLLLVIVAHYIINALEFFVHEYLGFEDVLPSITQKPT